MQFIILVGYLKLSYEEYYDRIFSITQCQKDWTYHHGPSVKCHMALSLENLLGKSTIIMSWKDAFQKVFACFVIEFFSQGSFYFLFSFTNSFKKCTLTRQSLFWVLIDLKSSMAFLERTFISDKRKWEWTIFKPLKWSFINDWHCIWAGSEKQESCFISLTKRGILI